METFAALGLQASADFTAAAAEDDARCPEEVERERLEAEESERRRAALVEAEEALYDPAKNPLGEGCKEPGPWHLPIMGLSPIGIAFLQALPDCEDVNMLLESMTDTGAFTAGVVLEDAVRQGVSEVVSRLKFTAQQADPDVAAQHCLNAAALLASVVLAASIDPEDPQD